MRLSESELKRNVGALLRSHGVEPFAADAVSTVIVAAERDGTHSHGLMRLPGYISSLQSGWVSGSARMTVTDMAPSILHVDADNGFAQAALALSRDQAIAKVRATGMCAVSIYHSHHHGSLWPDVEPFAREGFVCLAFVTTRSLMVAPGARRKVLGTNPMALALPRKDAPPLVWDQASSVMAHGDVRIAAREKRKLPPGAGVDRDGRFTDDPNQVLDGGAVAPFGGHKGFLIALLVEVFAAAMTGSRFGFEDDADKFQGAETSNGGQMFLLIDPDKTGAGKFRERIELLLAAIIEAGTERLPGDRRYKNRALAASQGIEVRPEYIDLLRLAT